MRNLVKSLTEVQQQNITMATLVETLSKIINGGNKFGFTAYDRA